LGEILRTSDIYKTPDEFATAGDIIRAQISLLLTRGSAGSAFTVGQEAPGSKRIELPKLLRFSSLTTAHANTMNSACNDLNGPVIQIKSVSELSRIRQHLMAQNPGQPEQPFLAMLDTPHEGCTQLIIGPGEQTKLIWKGLDGKKPPIYRSFMGFSFSTDTKIPYWQAEYTFDPGFLSGFLENNFELALQSAGNLYGRNAAIQPVMHRHFLLNFYLTPEPVDENTGFWRAILRQRMQAEAENTLTIETNKGRFNTIDFHTDTKGAIAVFENAATGFALSNQPDQAQKHELMAAITKQEQAALEHFQVVSLGSMTVSGRKFYVYSGAENPREKEKQPRTEAAKRWLQSLVPAGQSM
jgi:hypothetical protein